MTPTETAVHKGRTMAKKINKPSEQKVEQKDAQANQTPTYGDKGESFDPKLIPVQKVNEGVWKEEDTETIDAVKRSVRAALYWFAAGYQNGEFDILRELLTEDPKATFIGTGANEYKIGRDEIIEHWRNERIKNSLDFKLEPDDQIEMGFHGNVVCVVTRIYITYGENPPVETRCTGYVIRQSKIWKWASIHLSTPDQTQGDSPIPKPELTKNVVAKFQPVSLDELERSGEIDAKAPSRPLQLIITATQTERDAVLQKLESSPSDPLKFFTLDSEQEVFLGTFGGLPALVTQCSEGSGWEDSSEIALYRVLTHCKPQAVAVLGRAVRNPQSKHHTGQFLIAESLVRLGLPTNEEGPPGFGGVEPLLQHDLDVILKSHTKPLDSFSVQHVGVLVESPVRAYLPIRRLMSEIFDNHPESCGLLLEGASACRAAVRYRLKWFLVANILDTDPAKDPDGSSSLSATQAASFLRKISSGSEPWWMCESNSQKPATPQFAELNKVFDVFLCYNSVDRPVVKEIAKVLKEKYGLQYWLDVERMRPGSSFRCELTAHR
jgi:hypothetical protein